jgi:preprotein translocase subunit SecF
VALAHDLVITIGIYALVGFTVTPATMIGVLTILGYSLYDTVVVFDKVRENVAAMETNKVTYTEAANHAVNQVLVRSLNTTVIGVLPVGAILFAGVFVLGSGPLEDLGLALFVGMIAGAYSSIFIATPLLAQLREREPEMTAHRERVERRRRATEQRASFKATTVDIPATTSAAAAPTPANAITVTTVAAPKPANIEDVLEPETAELGDLVEADVEETSSPAADKVAPSANTTRNQSNKQTRTRRKR